MKQFVLAVAIVALIMLGGLLTETTYSDYEDFAGVKFPTKIRQALGDIPTSSAAYPLVSSIAPDLP